MNIVERAKAKWNKQANEYNQWIHLGTEEKLDLIIAEESSNHALLEDMAEVLQKLYDHTKNNMQICGLNSIASSVLTRYDITRAKERLGK